MSAREKYNLTFLFAALIFTLIALNLLFPALFVH